MKSLIIFLIAIIGLLGLYIFQVNAEISERFLIKECEQAKNDLFQENKILELGFSKDNSLEKIMKLAEGLNFEEIDKIHYIRVLNTQVVAK